MLVHQRPVRVPAGHADDGEDDCQPDEGEEDAEERQRDDQHRPEEHREEVAIDRAHAGGQRHEDIIAPVEQHRGSDGGERIVAEGDEAAGGEADQHHQLASGVEQHEVQEVRAVAKDAPGGEGVDDLRHSGPQEVEENEQQAEDQLFPVGGVAHPEDVDQARLLPFGEAAGGGVEAHAEHRPDEQEAAEQDVEPAAEPVDQSSQKMPALTAARMRP